MKQKQFKLNEHFELAVSGYGLQQQLLGSTLTREYNYCSGDRAYKGIKYYRYEYELNLWLVFVGLHIVYKPRLKKCGEKK